MLQTGKLKRCWVYRYSPEKNIQNPTNKLFRESYQNSRPSKVGELIAAFHNSDKVNRPFQENLLPMIDAFI